MRLKDKVIVVIGGSGLLGRTIISRIREEGGFEIDADIVNENSIENRIVNIDIGSTDSIEYVFRVVKEYFGRIDGVVNTAYPRTNDWGNKFENINAESWSSNVEMQMNSIFKICQIAFQFMKEQKSGSIVNMASIYGSVAPDFSVYEGTSLTMPAAYSAIKGGVINFSKYLAAYFGPFNIRVNCVSPGGVFDNQSQVFVKNYESKVPLKRMASTDDIAPSVCFLLSDESSYITGHNLIVDGGWTII